MANSPALPPGQALTLASLLTSPDSGIASRVLARSAGGNVTLFAFDAGQELTEHSSPYDALVIVLAGVFDVTIASSRVRAESGSIVRLPATVPHAVAAVEPSRMLLVMLRDGVER